MEIWTLASILSEEGAFNTTTKETFPYESRELNVIGTFVLIAHFQEDYGLLCAACTATEATE